MKAILLAAGLGTRLRPLTNDIPKCMVPICGRPLLEYWLRLMVKHGVSEVTINTHYLSEVVQEYTGAAGWLWQGLKIRLFHEKTLLGTGGTVRDNYEWIGGEPFLVIYGDNLSEANLSDMIKFHRMKISEGCLLTMGLFRTQYPTQCGIVGMDGDNRITSFIEKPYFPVSDMANAGIYVAEAGVLGYFPGDDPLDFGRHILPCLTGRMFGYRIREYHRDIGTMESYEKAQEEWGLRLPKVI